MITGFDADQDCGPVATRARAAGVSFCCRYLKNLHPDEVRALSEAGLRIVSIFESTAERALGGLMAGGQDGARARAQAAALGQPAGTAIFTTADFDASAAQADAVLSYCTAFKVALGGQYRLGLYANGLVCQMALDRGIADYAWLAGGMGMRGSRAFAASGRAAIIQDVGDKRSLNLGISIDSDVAASEDYGGWSLAAADPAPNPNPVPAPADPIRDAVMALQRLLRDARYYDSQIDGDPGPRTVAALQAYRSSKRGA